ncbi:MAG: 23S rRNA (pseudouridine(1915)-N(3))-methyltransferase RlmH [Methanoregula sp.]|nr:MAG: 23S rRNA (pseudouridine(1915)-N(3))-methyltransferase RlmH [Methanoregula sp.]
MQISIVAVGKIKEPYLNTGIAEYIKRLQPYVKIRVIEIADEKRPDDLSPAQKQQVLAREGENVLSAITDGSSTVALAVNGQQFSSEDLAGFLKKREVGGQSRITFIIGGDLGLSPAVMDRCDILMSLSPMTFTHPMVRLILLEQVYRAFRIMRGEPYHR